MNQIFSVSFCRQFIIMSKIVFLLINDEYCMNLLGCEELQDFLSFEQAIENKKNYSPMFLFFFEFQTSYPFRFALKIYGLP